MDEYESMRRDDGPPDMEQYDGPAGFFELAAIVVAVLLAVAWIGVMVHFIRKFW